MKKNKKSSRLMQLFTSVETALYSQITFAIKSILNAFGKFEFVAKTFNNDFNKISSNDATMEAANSSLDRPRKL